MALRLYRRHRKECEAKHPEDFRSSEFEEHRRGGKRCGCPIHVSGSMASKFKRQSTGQWEWDAAKEVVAQWESAGVWAIPAEGSPPKSVEPSQEPGMPTFSGTTSIPSESSHFGVNGSTP